MVPAAQPKPIVWMACAVTYATVASVVAKLAGRSISVFTWWADMYATILAAAASDATRYRSLTAHGEAG